MEERNTRIIEVNCANASHLHGEVMGIIRGVIRDSSGMAIKSELHPEDNAKLYAFRCTNEEFVLITSIFDGVLCTRPRVRYKVVK